ncbi:MAG: helix-turn-helix transcriptional regulator [Anaerolineales bacterium]|nr:helix-turn-helix transcriptional regulator [Anaerolineales bacterium]
MNFWNWLRQLFLPPRPPSPRVPDLYEGTIQIEQQAITTPLRAIAELEQRSPEDVANEILAYGLEKYEHLDEKLAKWHTLTAREQQVTALTCLKYTNHAIASKLIISPNTVKAHLRNVQQKFNVRNKEQLRQVLTGWDFSEFEG